MEKIKINIGNDGKYYVVKDIEKDGHKFTAFSFSYNGKYFSEIEIVTFEANKIRGRYKGDPAFGDIVLKETFENLSPSFLKQLANKITKWKMENSREYAKIQKKYRLCAIITFAVR